MSTNEQWQADWDEAVGKFRRYSAERVGDVVLVEAEAGTGSRAVVAITVLGTGGAASVGGSRLVSVLYPWQAAYPINSGSSDLVDWYVAEKFSGSVPARGRHGGDMALVTHAIYAALDLLDEYEIKPTRWTVSKDGREFGVIETYQGVSTLELFKTPDGAPISTLDAAAVRLLREGKEKK